MEQERAFFFDFLEHPFFDVREERVETLWESGIYRLERITSSGQSSDFYDQDEDEWVILLRGEAVVQMEDGRQRHLREGSLLFLPARLRHRVAATSEQCVWCCLFVRPEQGGDAR